MFLRSKLYEIKIGTDGTINILDTTNHGGIPNWIQISFIYLTV